MFLYKTGTHDLYISNTSTQKWGSLSSVLDTIPPAHACAMDGQVCPAMTTFLISLSQIEFLHRGPISNFCLLDK